MLKLEEIQDAAIHFSAMSTMQKIEKTLEDMVCTITAMLVSAPITVVVVCIAVCFAKWCMSGYSEGSVMQSSYALPTVLGRHRLNVEA